MGNALIVATYRSVDIVVGLDVVLVNHVLIVVQLLPFSTVVALSLLLHLAVV